LYAVEIKRFMSDLQVWRNMLSVIPAFFWLETFHAQRTVR